MRHRYTKPAIKLRRLMKTHELNCTQVAKLLDLHPVTVRRWYCGMINPQAQTIALLELLLQKQSPSKQ